MGGKENNCHFRTCMVPSALGVIDKYLLNTQISENYSIGRDAENHQVTIYCSGSQTWVPAMSSSPRAVSVTYQVLNTYLEN